MEKPYKADHMHGKRHPKDYTKEFLEDLASTTNTTHGIAIPVNVEIKANQKIIDYESMESILQQASKYVLQDCECRTALNNCQSPNDVCIALDDYADKRIEIGECNARYASYEEALDSVRRANQAGLVHMAYTFNGASYPKSICGCCECCCAYLGGVLRFGVTFPIVSSDKIASYNADVCINCGVCADRCNFGARERGEGKIVYHSDRCFGCSICTTTCPSQATHMIERI